ncbi:MAG: AAA family ATPase [Peptococcaceae bacterium]|nr:AAA family ATPase [Peptococcaceae bacterium]
MRTLEIPKTSLVVLCGSAGCGKTTFAARHFSPSTLVVSSDYCRALVSDDEENMAVSHRAFKLFRYIIDQRLALGRLTVADSTALTARARRELIALGRKHDFQLVLIVFDIPLPVCKARNLGRERNVPDKVLASHRRLLDKTLDEVAGEDFDRIYILNEEEKETARVKIVPLPVELPLAGPFDIIGDVHGCCDELEALLDRLGYSRRNGVYAHPAGRTAVFLGDLGDRGPRCLDSIELAMNMVYSGSALYVPGNHCRKLYAYFKGRKIKVGHGLEKTLAELDRAGRPRRELLAGRFMEMYGGAQPYLVLDEGRLVVSHAGIKENMIGRLSKRIRDFCLFGDTTGEVTGDGLPVRRDWAQQYRGRALVVYGHTPVQETEFRNNTIDIDQGCVMGGKLTALRYPELEIVQVEAREDYYKRPTANDGWPDYSPLP